MKNLDVNDWCELESVANNRLNPDAISGWFLGSILYSGLILIVAIFGLFKGNFLEKGFWMPIVIGIGMLVVINILIFGYFSKIRNMYNKQKLQAICLSVIATKISIDGYLVFFMSAEENMLPQSIVNVAFLAMMGGLILIGISTVRAIYRVKNGHFREGKNGLYDFKNSKIYFGFSGVFFFVMLGNIVVKSMANNGLLDYSLIFLLVLLVIVQYSISLAIPEFYLLTYCKFKYKQFNVEVPKKFKVRYEAELKSK